jgi:hypothetical protein
LLLKPEERYLFRNTQMFPVFYNVGTHVTYGGNNFQSCIVSGMTKTHVMNFLHLFWHSMPFPSYTCRPLEACLELQKSSLQEVYLLTQVTPPQLLLAPQYFISRGPFNLHWGVLEVLTECMSSRR